MLYLPGMSVRSYAQWYFASIPVRNIGYIDQTHGIKIALDFAFICDYATKTSEDASVLEYAVDNINDSLGPII